MKTKIFTFLFALVTSAGTMLASDTQVDGIWYNFDSNTHTAEVTYRGYSDSQYPDRYIDSVTIPSSVIYDNVTYSVTSIGENAFSRCSNLTGVTIPNSVTNIGNGAFSFCYSLTSITIPNSVTSIGRSVFFGCSGLTSPVYNAKIFVCLPSSYSGAYSIPDGIESIAYYAFYNCRYLSSVTIPNTVTSIGENAFQSCNGLTSVEIGSGVTSIGNGAFFGCTSITAIEIPNSVTSIGNDAFYGCTGLTEITIPKSVNSIGGSVFFGCSGLTSIIVLNEMATTRGDVIHNCESLKQISAPASFYYISPEQWEKPQYMTTRKLETIEITGGELADEAWSFISLSRKTLTSVNIQEISNTTLLDEMFKEFYNLQTLILPNNLTHIGYKSVAECIKLQSIDIPSSVIEIGDRAFEDCRSIETITFGGVQPASVSKKAFAQNTSISQLQRIGNWAFYNAHELQHLEIPEGVTEIGDGAFYGCTYLEDLVLPSSVRSIGDNCFALCAKMNKIIVNSVTPPEIEAKTFYDVKRQIPVYVPDDYVEAYKEDALWGQFNIQGKSDMPQALENMSVMTSGATKIINNGQLLIAMPDGRKYSIIGELIK